MTNYGFIILCLIGWFNSLEKRPSLWGVIEGIQRQEVWARDLLKGRNAKEFTKTGMQTLEKSRERR